MFPHATVEQTKSQIPSTKLQINLKFQYSMTETFHDETLFGFLNFGHCDLFVFWNFNKSMNFQQSKSALSHVFSSQ